MNSYLNCTVTIGILAGEEEIEIKSKVKESYISIKNNRKYVSLVIEDNDKLKRLPADKEARFVSVYIEKDSRYGFGSKGIDFKCSCDAYPVDIVINLEERHAASTEIRNIRTKWRDCVELSDEFFSAC